LVIRVEACLNIVSQIVEILILKISYSLVIELWLIKRPLIHYYVLFKGEKVHTLVVVVVVVVVADLLIAEIATEVAVV